MHTNKSENIEQSNNIQEQSNQIELTHSQLDLLLEQGYVVIDDFLEENQYQDLKQEANQESYKDAKITDGLQQDIRSDGIAWIEKEKITTQPQGNLFIQGLEQLAEQFNYTFFAGIRRCEAHFARYSAGKFYAKHVDNPKGSNHRVFSCVFYMNNEWAEDNGGELVVYLKKNRETIYPFGNRMVIFDSNLPHEVKPANRTRHSIACWLRQDS